MNKIPPRGFAIVGTVLVFCVVIILTAAATSLRLANQLGQGTEARQREDAQRLAEGCAETALQSLREDPAYAGNESIAIGTETWAVRPVLSGAVTTIQTEATVDGHPYRIKIELDDLETVHVTSWSHVVDF